MKQHEESSHPYENQNSLEIPHNQTLTHLFQESKENISLEKQSRVLFEERQSGKELLKPQQRENEVRQKTNVIKIEPERVYVRSVQNSNPKNNHHHHHQNEPPRMFSTISNEINLHPPQLPITRYKSQMQNQKKYQESSQTIKHKLPQAILDYITSHAKLKRLPSGLTRTQTGKKLGKLGLSKKLSLKYNTKMCSICETQAPQKEFQKMTKTCQHSYCSSCLHHYVIYKINAFEAVTCPNQGCNQSLDQDCQLYQELPLPVRKKYKKLLQYQMIKEHPNRKMCPKENCQGWIEINDKFDPVCNVCKKVYCAKCLLPYHDGDCDNKQLQFFQGTLHYRQCSKCKNVIEKSSGCIHMTCRCGYQFCYLCGAKWKHSHTCDNPDQERLHREEDNYCCCEINICDFDCDGCCDDCMEWCCDVLCCCCDNYDCLRCDNECCDCDCCDGDCCGCDCCECCDLDNCPCLRCLLGCVFKGFMVMLWITLIFPLVLIFDFLLMGVFWIIMTLLSGLTMYTIEIISQLQGCCFVASIIFYPITAFAGIALALRQVFSEVYLSHVAEVCQTLCQFFHEIFDD